MLKYVLFPVLHSVNCNIKILLSSALRVFHTKCHIVSGAFSNKEVVGSLKLHANLEEFRGLLQTQEEENARGFIENSEYINYYCLYLK